MTPPKAPATFVWWVVWFAILAALVVVYVVVAPDASVEAERPNLRYVPVLPLLLSAAVRWFALPRLPTKTRAFPLFVVGVALAEGAGLLGMFLVPDLRPTYLTLGLLGVAQFVPVFLSRFKE